MILGIHFLVYFEANLQFYGKYEETMVLVDGRGLGLQISTWDPHHEVYMRTVPGKHWLRCEGFKERVNHSAVKKEDDCSRFTNMNCLGVLKD